MDQHGDPAPRVDDGLTQADELSKVPIEHRATYAVSLRVIILLSILCWALVAGAVWWLVQALR